MFGPIVTDPILGLLRRQSRKRRRTVSLPSIPRDRDLIVEIPRNESVDSYLQYATNVITSFTEFQHDLSDQRFEDYVLYKKIDIEEGTFTENDLKTYPPVNASSDVWHVLQPYHVWLGRMTDEQHGNSFVLMDVDWPNPHFFRYFCNWIRLPGNTCTRSLLDNPKS